MEISNKAAQAIVYAINFHLEEQGLKDVREARLLAIQLAADVKHIMLEESQRRLHDFQWERMEGWDG